MRPAPVYRALEPRGGEKSDLEEPPLDDDHVVGLDLRVGVLAAADPAEIEFEDLLLSLGLPVKVPPIGRRLSSGHSLARTEPRAFGEGESSL